jgi:glycosyltransferase involved in cell wall biosynthesis
MRYGIITSARNEERVVRGTLESVCAQTLLPERWVIVDDGSTDSTAQIIAEFASTRPWIDLRRHKRIASRSFAGKADAVNGAFSVLEPLGLDAVVNLDADVSFEAGYFEFLLSRLQANPRLGVVGTPFLERGYDSARDSFEGENYVAGPCQVFRTACFKEIGGYLPNAAGGLDWIAVMTARMRGWEVRSFPNMRFMHHRTMGTAERGPLSALFSYGEKDYYLGGSPIWEICRVAYRLGKRPRIFGGFALLAGYCWAAIRRMKRPVSLELMRYHRRDQMRKLRSVIGSLIKLQSVDSFST